ncbi:MAG TPA: signal peptidase II [Acidimicrobiales bacterium]|nr:signal peptidase II [Acidimicrobiales bacterium]
MTELDADRADRAPGSARLVAAAAVAVAVVVVDQLTKWWAVTRLVHGPIHVIGTLDFELSRNTGASFSLFQGKAAVLVPVAVALVAVLSVMAWRAPSTGRAMVLGLILGGALGNLCDRFFRDEHGAVVDFVALHFWPTFNVADACIVVGCVLLVISLLRAPRLP